MLLTKMSQLRRLKIQLCHFLQEKYAQETVGGALVECQN